VFSGTGLTYTGAPATGSYIQIGNLINFRIKVNLTTVTNFGTGSFTLTLPPGMTPIDDYVFRDGGLHDTTANAHYQIYGDADNAGTTIQLMYHSGSKDLRMDHNSPVSLNSADFFYLSGSYQIP
jgi:hypothetical protein